MKRLKIPGAYYPMRSFTYDSVGSHIPSPDLGLSTRSLVRRARAASQTLDEYVSLHPGIRSGMIYRDSQVREYAAPAPVPPSVPIEGPVPKPPEDPAKPDTN